MMNDSDSLQIVIGLAKDSGRIEEQNNSLREELTDVKSQLATVSSENATLKKIIEELRESNKDKDATIASLQEKYEAMALRNAELQDIIAQNVSEGRLANPTNKVVVLNYYVLSVEKTVRYCGSLDDNNRLMINSLFQFSLPDNTPRHVFEKVNEMTRPLGVKRTEDLTDAVKIAATRPTNDTKIYPQSGSDVNVACLIKDTDVKSLPNPRQEVKMIELQDSEDNQHDN